MLAARLGSSALRRTSAARGIHATASAGMYFKRMELEVWFDKWQYVLMLCLILLHCTARCSVLDGALLPRTGTTATWTLGRAR